MPTGPPKRAIIAGVSYIFLSILACSISSSPKTRISGLLCNRLSIYVNSVFNSSCILDDINARKNGSIGSVCGLDTTVIDKLASGAGKYSII